MLFMMFLFFSLIFYCSKIYVCVCVFPRDRNQGSAVSHVAISGSLYPLVPSQDSQKIICIHL